MTFCSLLRLFRIHRNASPAAMNRTSAIPMMVFDFIFLTFLTVLFPAETPKGRYADPGNRSPALCRPEADVGCVSGHGNIRCHRLQFVVHLNDGRCPDLHSGLLIGRQRVSRMGKDLSRAERILPQPSATSRRGNSALKPAALWYTGNISGNMIFFKTICRFDPYINTEAEVGKCGRMPSKS